MSCVYIFTHILKEKRDTTDRQYKNIPFGKPKNLTLQGVILTPFSSSTYVSL